MKQTVPVANRRVWMLGVGVSTCLLVTLALTAVVFAGKPAASGGGSTSKITYTGASSGFRCDATFPGGVYTPTCTDNILGDTGDYVGSSTDTNFGTFFVTYSLSPGLDDLYFRLNNTGGRYIVLDFPGWSIAPTCTTTGKLACRKNFNLVTVTSTQLAQGLLVRPVDASDNELSGGMDAIPVGATVPANMLLNFPDPSGRSLWWTLRFDPKLYPKSNHVCVTHSDAHTWVVEAGGGLCAGDTGIADLVASPGGGVQSQTNEGWYSMPFALTVIK